MISRQSAVRRREPLAAGTIEVARGDNRWAADDFVDPDRPAIGRYGDTTWVFPADRSSGRPTRVEFTDDVYPTSSWQAVARDLAMALYGRRPGRAVLARGGAKPITIVQALGKLGIIARWAHAGGYGLPHEWTSSTVDSFVLAYHGSRLPNRVREENPKAQATTRHTLAAYLNLFAALHEHRHHLASGMERAPWSGWPKVGAYQVAGVVYYDECRTEIIDPDVWWAAVRGALRILNVWSPSILAAWHAYQKALQEPRIEWDKGGRERFHAWASQPGALVPITADGRISAVTVGLFCGVAFMKRGWLPLEARRLVEAKRAAGETTRWWWATATEDGSPSPLSTWNRPHGHRRCLRARRRLAKRLSRRPRRTVGHAHLRAHGATPRMRSLPRRGLGAALRGAEGARRPPISRLVGDARRRARRPNS